YRPLWYSFGGCCRKTASGVFPVQIGGRFFLPPDRTERGHEQRPLPVAEAGSCEWRSAPVFASGHRPAPQKAAKRKRNDNGHIFRSYSDRHFGRWHYWAVHSAP